MFLGCGRRCGLIDRDFKLEITFAFEFHELVVHFGCVSDGFAVFDCRTDDLFGGEFEFTGFEVDRALISFDRFVGVGLEAGPRQGVEFGFELVGCVAVGGVIDVIAGVDGEHEETGADAKFDIFNGLKVVGVGAETCLEAGLENTPAGIVHDLLGGAMGSAHLADGLLGKDGLDEGVIFGGEDMSGG